MSLGTMRVFATSLLAFLWVGCGLDVIDDSDSSVARPNITVSNHEDGGNKDVDDGGPHSMPPPLLDKEDSLSDGASGIVLLPRGSVHDSSLVVSHTDDQGVVHLVPATDGCVKVERLDRDSSGNMVNLGSYLECS